jgi:hypothetical protein
MRLQRAITACDDPATTVLLFNAAAKRTSTFLRRSLCGMMDNLFAFLERWKMVIGGMKQRLED